MTEELFGAEQALAIFQGICDKVAAGNTVPFEQLSKAERCRLSRITERVVYGCLRRHGAQVEHRFNIADEARGKKGHQLVLPNGERVSGFGRHQWSGTCLMIPRDINH